jgi:hypothetical protein
MQAYSRDCHSSSSGSRCSTIIVGCLEGIVERLVCAYSIVVMVPSSTASRRRICG